MGQAVLPVLPTAAARICSKYSRNYFQFADDPPGSFATLTSPAKSHAYNRRPKRVAMSNALSCLLQSSCVFAVSPAKAPPDGRAEPVARPAIEAEITTLVRR